MQPVGAIDRGLTDRSQVWQRITETRNLVAQALHDVHAVACWLRPAVLDDFGLAALERLATDLSASTASRSR